MDIRFELSDDPRETMIHMITEELGRIHASLGEIDVQIEQTHRVVNQVQQRNSDLATEIRTINDNLDTVPRQDIRTKYEEALDARFRLATMRGQLEKFQTNHEHLSRQQALLNQLLAQIQGVDALEVHEADGKPKANVGIVRVVQAQEEERQRLARQMHDGPAQSLTNFILQAEICQRLFDRHPDRAAEELDNLKQTANVTFQKVRDFIFDLRPMMLDDLGVVPTVRRHLDTFKEKYDIEARLDLTGEERRLESHREVMLFRAIQRLIGLSRDYANPSEISISLDTSGDVIKVAVRDDGRGFDVEAALMGEEGQHDTRVRSIFALREEFELVGGSLTVKSSTESNGTEVRLELPADDYAY